MGPTDHYLLVDGIKIYFADENAFMKALARVGELNKPRRGTTGSGIIDLHLPHLSPAYFSDGGDYFSNGVYQNFF